MQNDSKLPSGSNLRFAQPTSLRKPDAPGFDGSKFKAVNARDKNFTRRR
jgi:hypothetical protein